MLVEQKGKGDCWQRGLSRRGGHFGTAGPRVTQGEWQRVSREEACSRTTDHKAPWGELWGSHVTLTEKPGEVVPPIVANCFPSPVPGQKLVKSLIFWSAQRKLKLKPLIDSEKPCA